MNLIEKIKSQITMTELLNRLGIEINSGGFIFSIYKTEKTPSLKIYPDTNSYYDFSTNSGGDLIKFYSDLMNVSVSEAIKELADMFSIAKQNDGNKDAPARSKKSIPVNNGLKPKQYKSMLFNFEIERFTERAGICEFHGNLDKEKAEEIAFDYILKQRREIQTTVFTSFYNHCTAKGIDEQVFIYLTGDNRGLTADSINKYKLFSINSAKESVEFLKDSFSKDELLISGLFSKTYFIFAKHRIVIPYIEAGKIVYLRGRYFHNGKSEPDKFGKYIGLNNLSLTLSPKRFYNVDLLNRLSVYENLIITEGEFDCIMANQTGNNSIGISGVSNFPIADIPLTKHFNVYLLFDNDEAGRNAARKIANEYKRNEQSIKILNLKKYKDITELLK